MTTKCTLSKEQIEELPAFSSDEYGMQALVDQALLAIELEPDAMRYQWLRDQRLSGSYRFTAAMGWKPEALSCPQIDALIDAALQKG